MCGIAGFISFSSDSSSVEGRLNKLESMIKHRGPDGSGFHIESNRGFLNTRLAIVDRAGGAQPIYNDDKSVGIVYNGEVYNFWELRKDLEAKGHTFSTTSDTEAILKAYLEYGVESFSKLNGMFAFCIWDDRSKVTYLVRDQLGIKPLYIYQDRDKLLFASEIKAILSFPDVNRELDERGIKDYFIFRYTQAPFTCFKHIKKLEAGNYLKIEGDRTSRYPFYDVRYEENFSEHTPGSLKELKELTRQKLLLAVKSQLMGEVPIGVLLSGGVDSSAIAWCVHSLGANLTTYNVGFPTVNEFEFSQEVAKNFGLKHVEVTLTEDDIVNQFDEVIWAIDEPLADPACFPLHHLCKELKKSVTVVLSGEGGDELFGGYPQYRAGLNNVEATPEKQFLSFLDGSFYFRHSDQFFNNKALPPYYLRFRKYFLENSGLNAMLAYDMKTWMSENLMMKADKILMARSLEGRFPFLDIDFYRWTSTLSTELKISKDQVSKWLLKDSFREVLPSSILERPKMGFSVPVDLLLAKMSDRVRGICGEFRSHPLSDILDFDQITRLVSQYYNEKTGSALQVWTFFVFLSWFQANERSN